MNIARSSLVVTVSNLLSMGIGFVSNLVIAAKFGACADMDAYGAASSFQLFIYGMISSAISFTMIPVFSEFKAKGSYEMWRVVSNFVNVSAAFTGLLSLVVVAVAPLIVTWVAPGFSGDQAVLCASLLALIFPSTIALSIGDLFVNVYYLENRFIVPSLCKLINPLLVLTYVALFHGQLSTKSIALATLSASWCQLLILWLGFRKTRGFIYVPEFDLSNSGVMKILRLMLPLFLGMLVYRSLPVFDRFLISSMPTGSIAVLGYAEKLIGYASTLLVGGVSTAAFSRLSADYVAGKYAAFKGKVERIMTVFTLLAVPVTGFLMIYSENAIRLIFERGTFTHETTLRVAAAVPLVGLTLLPSVLGTTLGQCFYVIQRTGVSSALGVIEALIYMVMAVPLCNAFGLPGILIARVIDWYLSAVLSFVFLRRLLEWDLRQLLRSLLKIILVGFVMTGLAFGLRAVGTGMIVAGVVFVFVYALAVRFLNISEDVRNLEAMIRRRISAMFGT